MSIYFIGSLKELKKCVDRIDPNGAWRDLEKGCLQYRSAEGAVLNWWQKSMKLLFQGKGLGAERFERKFLRFAQRKSLIRGHVASKTAKVISPADRVKLLERRIEELEKAAERPY